MTHPDRCLCATCALRREPAEAVVGRLTAELRSLRVELERSQRLLRLEREESARLEREVAALWETLEPEDAL